MHTNKHQASVQFPSISFYHQHGIFFSLRENGVRVQLDHAVKLYANNRPRHCYCWQCFALDLAIHFLLGTKWEDEILKS